MISFLLEITRRNISLHHWSYQYVLPLYARNDNYFRLYQRDSSNNNRYLFEVARKKCKHLIVEVKSTFTERNETPYSI